MVNASRKGKSDGNVRRHHAISDLNAMTRLQLAQPGLHHQSSDGTRHDVPRPCPA